MTISMGQAGSNVVEPLAIAEYPVATNQNALKNQWHRDTPL